MEKPLLNKDRFWKNVYLVALFLIGAYLPFALTNKEDVLRVSFDPSVTIHYFKTGNSAVVPDMRQLATKVYHIDGVVPTVSNGGQLDVSWLAGTGSTVIKDVQVSIQRNTTNSYTVPAVSLKEDYSLTPVSSLTYLSYNIVQANSATVAILGINVLSGSPQVFASSLSDIKLNFTITCYTN